MKYYTTKDVCAMLHISRSLLYQLTKKNKLSCIKFGDSSASRVLYTEEAINKFIANCSTDIPHIKALVYPCDTIVRILYSEDFPELVGECATIAKLEQTAGESPIYYVRLLHYPNQYVWVNHVDIEQVKGGAV